MVSFQICGAIQAFVFVFIDENVETPLIYSKWFLDLYFQNELFSNKQLNKLTHKVTDVETNMATF